MARDNEQYTRTGGEFFNRMANFLSYVPGASKLKIFAGYPIAAVADGLDAIIGAGKWLIQGKIFSALTVLAAGSASAIVNGLGGLFFGLANIGSGLATGETLGTHARKATEMAIGGITGLVGRKPTVLQTHYAGIGGINGGFTRQGPGPWANYVSQRSGRDPTQQWAAYENARRAEAGQIQTQR